MDRIRRSLVVALALLFFSHSPATAQTGTLMGSVSSAESGHPIPAALIQATSAGEREVANGLSNQNGRYRLSGLSPGMYMIKASVGGFADARVHGMQITAGATAIVDFTLNTSMFELDPLVVSVSKETEKALEAPAHVVVITEGDIAVRPTVTPADHLRSTSGVDIVTSGVQSSNVVVRGFNNFFSGTLHMLVDNRIAGIPSLRANWLHFIPHTNEDFERMEVVLGPGSALYGPNTANGVLHIITKSPLASQGTTFSLAGGERSVLGGTFRTAHLLGENFGFKVSMQYVHGDEWQHRDSVEVRAQRQATRDPNAFRASLPLDVEGRPLTEAEIQQRIARLGARDFEIQKYAIDARADWRATDDLTAIFSAGRTISAEGIELAGVGAAQVKDWAYGYYQLRARWNRLIGQVYLNTSDTGETFFLRTGAPVVDRSKIFVTQLQHGSTVWVGRQNFTYGADFIRTIPVTDRTINGSREEDDNFDEFGAYLQSETRLSPLLELFLAGRYDKHSELDDPVFSPRAALVFKATDEQSFRLTYNRAFSTPSSLNLFLDADGGPAGPLGPLGFRVRAQGPGNTGFRFRDASGNLFGIRSPFAAMFGQRPSDLLAINTSTLYDLQLAGLASASAARGQPLPETLIAAIGSLKLDPAFSDLTTSMVDPVTQTRTPFASAQITDVPEIEESMTETFELGYKGILGQKLLLEVDLWHDRKENFISPLVLQTPLLLVTPEQLVPFLVQRLKPVVGEQTALQLAQSMAQIPGGVVGSPDMTAGGADLLATYINFGKLDLTGVDVSATALITDQWQLGVSGSFVSDDFFRLPLQGQDRIVALNAPKKKGTVSVSYQQDSKVGLNLEARVRYTDGFPVNSGDFIGTGCIAGGAGDCVKSYTLFDLTLGHNIPSINGGVIQLTIQNLLDEDYRSFVGVPAVGRMALLRVKYDF